MIDFFIPCIPPTSTSQTKRLVMIQGKPRFFPNKKVAAAKKDLMLFLKETQPKQPMEGPIELWITFIWPWRSAEPKRNRAQGTLHKTTKPDCDNLAKLITDCLTKLVYWNDDSQVCRLRVAKYWGSDPGISVTIFHPEEINK